MKKLIEILSIIPATILFILYAICCVFETEE